VFFLFQYAPKGTYQIAALSDSSIVSVLQWSPESSGSAAASSSAAAAAASSSSSTPVCVVSVPHASSQSEAAKRRDESHKSSKHKNKAGGTAASSTLLAGDEGDAIGAGTVQALHFATASSLMVARGDAVRPLFQQVVFAREDGSFEAEIVLPKYQHAHLMSAGANAAAADGAAAGKKRKAGGGGGANNEPVTLGAAHMGDLTAVARSGLDGQDEDEEGAARDKKRAKLATSKSKSDVLSLSLAERLAESDAASAAAIAAGQGAFSLETPGALPKAGSLQTILQQALHSNDAALVEYCLTAGATAALQGNAALVRVTVRRLSPVYVLPLLQHLMSKFSSRPNRAASLLPWLREVFSAHTAFLIRQPSLANQLAPLTHLLDQRSAVFKKMLKLQARLDLLLGQIAHTHAAKASSREDDEAAELAMNALNGQGEGQGQALNTYNDGEDEDDDDEEEQDEFGDEDDEDEDEGEEGEDEEEEGEEGEEEEEDEDDDMGGEDEDEEEE
jgi:U3 small nucleolar RNA-associated protein 5